MHFLHATSPIFVCCFDQRFTLGVKGAGKKPNIVKIFHATIRNIKFNLGESFCM